MALFFSNEKGVKPKPRQNTGKDSAVTILTAGCHFNGRLYCKGSSRIGGRIEGEIESEGVLIIEDGAVIAANVKAEEVILHGKFTGHLKTSTKVELCESSTFDGTLETPTLLIREGAKFNGQVKMHYDESGKFVGLDMQKKKTATKDVGILSDISISK